MFGWFDASEAIAFGERLAEYYDQEWRALESKAAHKQEDKRNKLVAKVLQQAQQFGRTHKLNGYKMARLGNVFKWKLIDLGYQKELIDLLTKDVLIALR
ncbi:MAG: hypothetical protein LC110_06295 [Burkholderiales bacterium]|nr:hypothetical protein [Burkholderiales bacterium]